MHYRCKECAEVFALERIRESGAPRTSASFCPFCGAQAATPSAGMEPGPKNREVARHAVRAENGRWG